MLFSLLKHHFDLNITDTALKVSRSFYCFTTSISHGVENYFPRLWDTGISDAIFNVSFNILYRPYHDGYSKDIYKQEIISQDCDSQDCVLKTTRQQLVSTNVPT